MLAALAHFGPMQMKEFDDLLGRTRSSITVKTSKSLEKRKVCIRTTVAVRHKVTAELDPKHPAAPEIRRFARKLYEHYIGPIAVNEPPVRQRRGVRAAVGATPKHDPATLDLHILGNGFMAKMLHLLVETGPCQALALVKPLGASRAVYDTLRIWERFGIVNLRKEWVDLIVSFNEDWFAYEELRDLLRVLNRLNNREMLQYVSAGEAYRQSVAEGRMDTYWRVWSKTVPDAEKRLEKRQTKKGIVRKAPRPENIGQRNRKFSDAQVAEMRTCHLNGEQIKSIAQRFGCSYSYARALISGTKRPAANAAQQMTNECRDAVLAAARRLRANGQDVFSIADIVAECRRVGERHSARSIAQQITGQMCMNTINRSRKVRVFNDLVQVNRGRYRLF